MNTKRLALMAIPVIATLLLGTVAFAPQAYAGSNPFLIPPAITETLEQGETLEVAQTLDPELIPDWTADSNSPLPDEDCFTSGFLENINAYLAHPDPFVWLWKIMPQIDAIPGEYTCTVIFSVDYYDPDGVYAFTNHAEMLMTITVVESSNPVEKIEGLIDDVDALDLNQGNKNALTKKLANAIKNITNEDPADDAEACEKLQSFIDHLNAMVSSGKLTQEQADPLIDIANQCIWDLCLDA